MSEILQKWLSHRLGIVIDYNLTSFEDVAQDGTLIARVLYNYGIITFKNMNQIVKTYDLQLIERNLAQIRLWLKNIGLNLSEKDMHGICHREKSVAAKVFYNLYVILNTRSKIDNFLQIPSESRYNINDPEVCKTYNACEINQLALSPIADEIRGVLREHRCKYKELSEKCKTAKDAYKKLLEDKLKNIEVKKPLVPVPPKHDTLTMTRKCKTKKVIDPLRKPDISVKIDKDGKCIKDVKKAENYINYLKKKYETCTSIKKINKHLNKLILFELMNNIVGKEDQEFKNIIIQKLLKQSHYEKQMAIKAIHVRYQKEVMLQDLQRENAKIIEEKEREFSDQLFQQRTNLTLREQQFDENRQRQFDLHRKLWNEKLEKEHKIAKENCEKIVFDLVDLAMKFSNYRRSYGSVSPSIWNEWCVLFRTEQPIFEHSQNVTQILSTEPSDVSLTLEFYRQNGLDEGDFRDYEQHYGIWEIEPALEFFKEHQPEIELGAEILAFIVNRLLLMKYPKPEQIKSPTFSQTDIRAAIVGLNTFEVIPLLQKTLKSKEIVVIEMHDVVNSCIQAYLEETKAEVDDELEKTKSKLKRVNNKEKGDSKKAENKSRKGSKKSREIKEPIVLQEAKETQTPNIFPGEDVSLSEIAKLGKFGYETLNLGQQLNEGLVTLMLAEYVKNYGYLKGFVLVNFPQSVNEAFFLEELYNDKKIPNTFKPDQTVSIEDLEQQLILEENEYFENREQVFKLPEDEFVSIRRANILRKKNEAIAENENKDKYESFFTSVTFLQYRPPPRKSRDNNNSLISQNNFLGDNNNSPLVDFYKKLKIANELTYDKITFETLKELVYLISKDVILAQKIYEELQELAVTKSSKKPRESKGKMEMEKSVKDLKKGKKGNKDEKKLSAVSEGMEIIEELSETVESPKFVELPLVRELARLLATTWQDLEQIYINDFKELFFVKRISQNEILPYVKEVENNLQKFVDRPDMKQTYLHDFQTAFNEIQADLRDDTEYKAELHYRVQEFKNKLYDICDKKMRECEEERRRIIEENWFTDHTMNSVNIFIKAAQLELDRCVGTLQFLQDYYTSMAQQQPMENKLTRPVLDKIDLRRSDEKMSYATALTNAFLETKTVREKNPFVNFLDASFEKATNAVNSLKLSTNPPIKLIETLFAEKEGPIPKAKKEKPSKKAVKKGPEISPEEIAVTKNVTKMCAEWRNAIEGEISRTLFRLQMIHGLSVKNIEENLASAEYLFKEIYSRIQERYNDEVESVDVVCQVFSRAIEAGEPIQLRLVLDGTKFSIDDTKLFYPDAPFEYGQTKEKTSDYNFSVAQLNVLLSILMDLSPNGIMTKKLFTYLMEDMISITIKDSYICPLPFFWRCIQPNTLPRIVETLYLKNDFVDWKDFIIWNLLVPFPNEEQIISMRNQFREMDPDKLEYVNSQQFSTVKFWFDFDEYEYKQDFEVLRNDLIKDLLMKLFQVGPDRINYSGLLLYFCKDEEAMKGFIKALELATGQLVCWDVTIGERYIGELRKQKAIETAKTKDALSAANSAIEKVFHEVCAECISTFSFLDTSDGTAETNEEERGITSPEMTNILEEEEEEGEEVPEGGLPNLCYFLKWPVLLKVMSAAFSKELLFACINGKTLHDRLKQIYCDLQIEEFDKKVFMHDFLNEESFYDIVNNTTKFMALYPPDVVRNVIEVCTCEKHKNDY